MEYCFIMAQIKAAKLNLIFLSDGRTTEIKLNSIPTQILKYCKKINFTNKFTIAQFPSELIEADKFDFYLVILFGCKQIQEFRS